MAPSLELTPRREEKNGSWAARCFLPQKAELLSGGDVACSPVSSPAGKVGGTVNSRHQGWGSVCCQGGASQCPNEPGPTSPGRRAQPQLRLPQALRPVQQSDSESKRRRSWLPKQRQYCCHENIPLLGSWQLFLLRRFLSSVKPFLRRALL